MKEATRHLISLNSTHSNREPRKGNLGKRSHLVVQAEAEKFAVINYWLSPNTRKPVHDLHILVFVTRCYDENNWTFVLFFFCLGARFNYRRVINFLQSDSESNEGRQRLKDDWKGVWTRSGKTLKRVRQNHNLTADYLVAADVADGILFYRQWRANKRTKPFEIESLWNCLLVNLIDMKKKTLRCEWWTSILPACPHGNAKKWTTNWSYEGSYPED